MPIEFNPELDLELRVEVPITPAQLFAGWTDPVLLPQWFCPRPRRVTACEIEPVAGGIFSTVMTSPEGEAMPESPGCFLHVEAPSRIVWTNMLSRGFRPNPPANLGFGFVCELRFTPSAQGGAHFHAVVRHTDAQGREQHAQMGFDQGWRIALSQLVELYR